jgi:hypothetical protein
MLLSVDSPNTPSTQRLTEIWAARYAVDLSSLSENPKFYGELVKAASPEARVFTVAKLLKNISKNMYQEIEAQAISFYEYIPNIITSSEVRNITQIAYKVYQNLLEIYQQECGLSVFPITKREVDTMTPMTVSEETSLMLSGIPDILKLTKEMEEILLKFQEKYVATEDWRTVGFLTTVFNLSNKLIINYLTPPEKVLLCPYFKFIEEQVSMPWERVCAASSKHGLDSPAFTLVEQMFPMASDISSTVFCQILQLFPYHRSKRGNLSHPGVVSSFLRDLDMFQAYLWLSILEDTLRPLERELVPLCVMVLPSVGVVWELVNKSKQLLVDEILSRVASKPSTLLLNYTQGMEEVFFNARKQMGESGEVIKMPYQLSSQ